MANTLTHRIRLDKLSAEPLFVQVENSLNSAIESGEFLPGERIPTELELADIYGVSRITIRGAINELCQHGLLVKKQGRGTFVQERRMSRKIEHIASFTVRSEEHTSELQSLRHLVCRLLLEKKKKE